ncbi:MAG: hypothetical protein DHS20C01_27020 [marine bacterium B5-7]|nr:MAG: hypothetical protein DHS20C01_27020 [marine bacterium B5-7]
MIGLVVGGILVALTIPTFRSFITSSDLDSETDQLLSAINTARSMAMANNTPAILCAATSTGTCSTNSSDWENGWLAFLDCDGDGQYDDSGVTCPGGETAEPVFGQSDVEDWSIAMNPNDLAAQAQFAFDTGGRPVSTTDCWGASFTLTKGNNTRSIYLNDLGRAHTIKGSGSFVSDSCDAVAVAASTNPEITWPGTSTGDDDDGTSTGDDDGGTSTGDDDGGTSTGDDDGGTSTGDDDGGTSTGDDDGGTSTGDDDDGTGTGDDDTGGGSDDDDDSGGGGGIICIFFPWLPWC